MEDFVKAVRWFIGACIGFIVVFTLLVLMAKSYRGVSQDTFQGVLDAVLRGEGAAQ